MSEQINVAMVGLGFGADRRGIRRVDQVLWAKLKPCVDAARSEWKTPDHGIWEVRTSGRTFTYSAALCQVALDRGARLAKRFHLPGDVAAWEGAAAEIRAAVLEQAWDEKLNSLTEHLGKGALDASLLSLPIRRVIPADHPRMVATTAAIAERLGAGDGLLYRYNPDRLKEGLNPLQLDSGAPKLKVEQYLNMENRFKMLTKSKPEEARRLFAQAQTDADVRWRLYESLAARDFKPRSGAPAPATVSEHP